MPHRIDCVSEHQVLQASVPVGAHDKKVRRDLARIVDDLAARLGGMPDRGFHVKVVMPEGGDQGVEILATRFHLRGRRKRPVNLTGDTFFHVEQKELRPMRSSQR